MPFSNLRVLLAEDNLINQKVTQHMLHYLGLEADVVSDGHGVLHALHQSTYDLVLMDVHMPSLDGIEATRQLRQQVPQSKQPYVVALTASTLDCDRQACFQAGMDYYVAKPLKIESLRALLQRVC